MIDFETQNNTPDRIPSKPRKNPCASCPYRANVPSGVWDETEYSKLPRYDGEIFEQTATALFMCHQPGEDHVCSGWLGHRDVPDDLLAVHLGLMNGDLDLSCQGYSTDVPLFESGAAAAEHGMQQFLDPPAEAVAVIKKIVRKSRTHPRQTTSREP